jgi:uncharacterized protein YcbK (DUF882 family)
VISKQEILMNRDKQYPNEYTKEVSDNIDKLLIALNKFRVIYGKPMTVSSGWRPEAVNASISNAAKKSNHVKGLACDFKDGDGELDKWCMTNLKVLEDCGLYLEHPDATLGWCHLQCVPPKSGNRVFKP